MSKLETNRDAMAEIRRAQEAARKAAMERARLLAAQAAEARQAQQAQENQQANVVTRDTFVQEAQIEGTTEAERGELFDQFDTDGETGLSETEFDAAWNAGAEVTVPEGEVSEGVQDEIDNALKDDENTDGDLMDAAGKAETAEDVRAIMAAAQTRDQNQQELLREVLNSRDPDAEDPAVALFEAVAQEYERLDKPEMAGAVRLAGDPSITAGVRGDLVRALKDNVDTPQDLVDAARNHVETPEDLAAIFAVKAATGKGDAKDILQAALLHIDEDSENPNIPLLEAIGDQYAENDMPKSAQAMRVIADPGTSPELREKLIHALQDEEHTDDDIEAAAGLAEGALEVEGTVAAGEAQGIDGAGATVALEQVNEAMAGLEEAQEDAKKFNQDLLTIQSTAGLTDDQKAAMVEAYRTQNAAEFQKVADAEAHLAEVMAANQDGLTQLLSDPRALGEDTAGTTDKLEDIMGAMEALAIHPEHYQVVEAITAPVMARAPEILAHAAEFEPDPNFGEYSAEGKVAQSAAEAVTMLSERIAPAVTEASIMAKLGDNPNPEDVEAAFNQFEQSPMGTAITGLGSASDNFSTLSDLESGYHQLRAVALGSPASAALDMSGKLEDLSGQGGFGKSFASLGLALNGIAFKEAWESGDALATIQSGTMALGDVAALAAAGTGKLSLAGKAAGEIFAPIGAAFDAYGGIQAIMADDADAYDYAQGALGIAGAAAGLASMWVPGLNVVAGVCAVAALGVSYASEQADANESSDRIMAAYNAAEGNFETPLNPIKAEIFKMDLPGDSAGGSSDKMMDELLKNVTIPEGHFEQEAAENFRGMMRTTASSGIDSVEHFMREMADQVDLMVNQPGPETAVYNQLFDELASQLGYDPAEFRQDG